MKKKLLFIFLCIPVIILFSNVMHFVISHVKKELYEKTQKNIAQNNFRKSEIICFSGKYLEEADFSEKLAYKKTCLKFQIDLPDYNKGLYKTSVSFAVIDTKEFCFFSNLFLKLIFKHYHQPENTHYLPILFPPPEMNLMIGEYNINGNKF